MATTKLDEYRTYWKHFRPLIENDRAIIRTKIGSWRAIIVSEKNKVTTSKRSDGNTVYDKRKWWKFSVPN